MTTFTRIIQFTFGMSSILLYCLVVFGLYVVYNNDRKTNIFYLILLIHGMADICKLIETKL